MQGAYMMAFNVENFWKTQGKAKKLRKSDFMN